MVAALDVTGKRYGRLVAVERLPSGPSGTRWRFRCDCGAVIDRTFEPIRSGFTKSCGCLRVERTVQRSVTHGASRGRVRTPELRAWEHAKQRCANPRDAKYANYGARGIAMCDEWRNDFAAFLRDMGPRPNGTTLDRIDVNGGYEPGNCRWATASEQARTRTDNVVVEHDGRRLVLKDFAAEMGVSYKSLHSRVKYRGQTPAEAVAALRRS